MLDLNALAQLKTLKENINEAKPRLTGTVRGTLQRFGFVVTDDGKSYFLAPEQMERVFPNDVVEFCPSQDKDGKDIAELETLLESTLQTFVGSYIVKGKAHCVAPDVQGLTRWIFIPPTKRQNAKADDLIQCRLIQHPFDHEGKAQAEVISIIGASDAAKVEHHYIATKHQILSEFSEFELSQANEIAEQTITTANRSDYRELAFCTIDSEKTEDMDDAFFVQKTESGYNIKIAIADPSAFIAENSSLDQTAMRRVSSAYFPGNVITMLPVNLTNDVFSLRANADRLALVVDIQMDNDGSVTAFEFVDAVIHSQGKLSYDQVALCFDNNDFTAFSPELAASLQAAEQASLKRVFWRKEHCTIANERPDYRIVVDDNWKMTDINKLERQVSHQIIEEFMLLANVTAANYLKAAGQGNFQSNAGIRPDKFEEIEILCRQHWDIECPDLTQNNAYKLLLERLNGNNVAQRILTKCFSRTETSKAALPHNLMGFDAYTTITSPIRRYLDLHLHRVIRAIRDQQTTNALSDSQLEHMNQYNRTLRQASNELEAWLIRNWLVAKQGQEFSGEVQHLTNAGIAVTLLDIGINGFVVTKSITPELKFNGLI